MSSTGLDGCLLELEEIFRLRGNHPLKAALMSCINSQRVFENLIEILKRGGVLDVFVYDEIHSHLNKIQSSGKLIASSWFLILVPSGFDLIDVGLVNLNSTVLTFCGIQITRSAKPFARHHTFDTCLPKSKERLEKLLDVIVNTTYSSDKTLVQLCDVSS
jgi:hypothetical protein